MRREGTLKLRWRCLISGKARKEFLQLCSSKGLNGGFTLIEVLVSIFIGAIVLSVIYASFFQIIGAKDTAENELEFYHEARVILSRLREDLTMAYPRGAVYSKGGSKYDFFIGEEEGKNGSVSFTSLSHGGALNSTGSDQARISYYLQPIPDSDLFSLIREENPLFGSDSGGVQYPISERVVEFSLSYMRPDEGGFVKEWDSTQSGSLPKAVELTLVMRSPRGEDILFNSLILIPVAEFESKKSNK